MVGGKEVFFRVVQSDHADHTLHALERNGERRRQRAVLRSIVQITGLNRRIAIQDRLAVLRDPPRQSLSNRNAQRGKQPEVVAIHILRHKFLTLADVDGNRIVGNRPPQLHRKHRERFAQAERSSQILAKLEKGLCFLARRRDRTQKTALRQLPPPLRLEPGVRPDGRLSVCVLVFDFHFRGQFLLAQIVGALVDQFFQLQIFAFEHPDHFRIKSLSRFTHQLRHRFIHRQRAPILPVRSHRIQKIHRRQDAGANRNLAPAQSQRIARPIVLFVMGPYDGHDRVWKTHSFEDFRSHQRMNLHFLEFFRRQAARFRNDVLRNRQLADVMQQGRGLQGLHSLPVNL